MLRCFPKFLFLLIACLAFSFVNSMFAYGQVSGLMEWNLGHYEGEVSGVEVQDADHFAQKYALTYRTAGRFLNGRGGRYNLELGGEWFSFDTDVTLGAGSSNINKSSSKVLYLGDITIAPGGLPFRLYAYSRDRQHTIFERDSLFFSEGSFGENTLTAVTPQILTPNVIDDISNGVRIESGLSLVVGIKNGSYLGRYRDIMSGLPKLFTDYRETYVKDLESITPEHYVDRELAFVSLNKKNNWFHYRVFEHRDKINPQLDSSRTSFLLGNVNHRLVREWVNLTNWIQISSDLSYTEEKNIDKSVDRDLANTYALNLFARARRSNWRSHIYPNFQRTEEENLLTREYRVPLFAEGEIDRSTSWRTQFITRGSQQIQPFALVNQESDEYNNYTTVKFETRKTTSVIISPLLEFEDKQSYYGNGSALLGGFELFSNRKLNPGREFFTRIDASYFQATDLEPYSDVDFTEFNLEFDYSKRLNARLRSGLETAFIYGDGQLEYDIFDYIEPRVLNDTNSVKLSTVDVSDNVWRLNLLVFADHVAKNRLRNRIEAGYDQLEDGTESFSQYFLKHRLDLAGRTLKIRAQNELYAGDNLRLVTSPSIPQITSASALVSNIFDGFSFNHISSIDYTPNRNWTARSELSLGYVDSDNSEEGGQYIDFSQSAEYVFYTIAGRIRRLYDLEGFVEYLYINDESGADPTFVAIIGNFNYYPTSWSRLGGKIRNQKNIENGLDELGFGIYAGLDFPKLDVNLEYEIGMRSEDDFNSVPERNEERWNINVRKTF